VSDIVHEGVTRTDYFVYCLRVFIIKVFSRLAYDHVQFGFISAF